jgi:hypothetical protein
MIFIFLYDNSLYFIGINNIVELKKDSMILFVKDNKIK